MLYAGIIGGGGTARIPPKTAAAIAVIAAGMLLLAGILAHVSPDVPDGWPLGALPAFFGEAFAHIIDALRLTGVSSLEDNGSLGLDEPRGVVVATVGGNPVAFVAGSGDNGVQAVYLGIPNFPVATGNILDDGDLELDGAWDIDVWAYDGKLYAAVVSFRDDGIQIVNVTDTGSMEGISNKKDHSSRRLDGPVGVDVYEDDGRWYAAVVVDADNAVQVFNVTNPADIGTNDYIEDNGSLLLEDPRRISVYKSDGHVYAAVTSNAEGGIQILNLDNPNSITAAGQMEDNSTLTLDTAFGIEVVGQTAYVASQGDHGVQVLDVSDPENIEILGDIAHTDGSGAVTNLLRGATNIKLFSWDDSSYLAVIGQNGVQILNVSDGALYSTNKDDMLVGGLVDADALNLARQYDVAHFQVANEPYLAVTSLTGNAIRIIKIADGPTSINTPPVVDAGANQTVNAGDTVTIGSDAVVTDADSGDQASLTYRWSIGTTYAPGHPFAPVRLADQDSLITTFIPTVINNEDFFRFRLSATDHHGDRSTDHVWVTVNPNRPPTVNAGPDQLVVSGSLVHLFGTATDPEGHTPLTYLWEDSTDPMGHTPITFGRTTSLATTFTAPTVTANVTITLRLTATDSHGQSASDKVNVTVWNPPSDAPVVDAGSPQVVDEGTSVTLTGTASDPEGEAMTFSWVCRSTYHTFTAGTDISVTFTAPSLSRGDVTYTCTFTATDPHRVSASDTVRLLVRDLPDDGPVLLVTGDRNMLISTTSYWVDPGAKCVTARGGDTLPVTVSGSVDLSTAGKYTISYTCSHAGHTVTHDRIIHVQHVAYDAHPTVIITYHRGAIGSDALNADYSDDAVCRDQEDGDISHRITTSARITGNDNGRDHGVIVYSCTDSAGHTTNTSIKVSIYDGNSPPTIDLIGGTMHLNIGDTWKDPGATCTDAEDGTWTIYASRNTVDTTTPGHYLAIYECIDSDGARQVNGGVRHVHVSGGDLPPVLSVSPTDITININETLPAITATCTDKEDGDLTDFIEVKDNTVETTNEGVYYITYECTDSANNFTIVYVKITVQKP